MAEAIVFAGPTLHRIPSEERDALLAEMELRPPVRRGDITACLVEDVPTIVVLDGYFFSDLAVAHKELIRAVESGRRVIGASSMGALRAAETDTLGVEGVGAIYRLYRDGVIDGDDEVAVMHLPEDFGFRPTTVALIEVRYALELLVKTSGLAEERASALIDELKDRWFGDRSVARIEELAIIHLGPSGAQALSLQLESFSLKADDARRALVAAKQRTTNRAPDPQDRSMFFTYWCENHVRVPVSSGLPRRPTLMQGLSMVQLFHPEAPAFVESLRKRYLAASAAAHFQLRIDEDSIREMADRLDHVVRERHAGAVLPSWDIEAEATVQVMSNVACHTYGGEDGAIAALATKYAFDPPEGGPLLLGLVAAQYGRLTTWSLVRASVFASTLQASMEVAESVEEIYESFLRWSRGARIERDDLKSVATELWACDVDSVEREARARGLLESHGFSVGVHEVFARVAPALRLPQPINDFPLRRRALEDTDLSYAVPLFPDIDATAQTLAVPSPRRSFPLHDLLT